MNDSSASIPVVDVDQSFPLLTTEVVRQRATGSSSPGDLGPLVESTLRDVLGWRPRAGDTTAFTAALAASFDVSLTEGHVTTTYRPRGFSMQADLGAVSGGQASLYARARASRVQMLPLLDGLRPLRNDADPQDCDAYRILVRDTVTRLVGELGTSGGPRVPVIDSAFTTLTGWQPPQRHGQPLGVMFRAAGTDPDRVPGLLGALRERFGLTDINVNTVDEEQVRTAFWTLVDLVLDLQRSWELRRRSFLTGSGAGFLGTELVLVSRLLHAAAEQVDELEAVLDSVLIPLAERQTLVLDAHNGLTLAGLLDWLRVFLVEDGPRTARDTARDGILTVFTPTAVALRTVLSSTLAAYVVRTQGDADADDAATVLPLDPSAQWPAGLYSARVRIAVASLMRQLDALVTTSARIGRYPGVILFDVTVSTFTLPEALEVEEVQVQRLGGGAGDFPPFDEIVPLTREQYGDVVKVTVRGHNLQESFLPAFVSEGRSGALTYHLPLRGSASHDSDTVEGLFLRPELPAGIRDLLDESGAVLVPAQGVPLVLVDEETSRPVTSPPTRSWPSLGVMPHHDRINTERWESTVEQSAGSAPTATRKRAGGRVATPKTQSNR